MRDGESRKREERWREESGRREEKWREREKRGGDRIDGERIKMGKGWRGEMKRTWKWYRYIEEKKEEMKRE